MCSQGFAGFCINGGWCALVKMPACRGQRLGCKLTNLFGTIESIEIKATPVAPVAPTKKHTWLPVLTVLFLISYAIMTLLIVEQGQTIESQRALIRELFQDSTELSATKIRDQRAAQASHLAQNPSSQTPSTQAPSTQAPSTQAQTKQAPSTQVEPQHRAQNQVKPKYQVPSKPASDLADKARTLITI